MDIYRRGGDSLMGRYFPYRMHPFSVAETLTQALPDPKRLVRPPTKIKAADFDALWSHARGGSPDSARRGEPLPCLRDAQQRAFEKVL